MRLWTIHHYSFSSRVLPSIANSFFFSYLFGWTVHSHSPWKRQNDNRRMNLIGYETRSLIIINHSHIPNDSIDDWWKNCANVFPLTLLIEWQIISKCKYIIIYWLQRFLTTRCDLSPLPGQIGRYLIFSPRWESKTNRPLAMTIRNKWCLIFLFVYSHTSKMNCHFDKYDGRLQFVNRETSRSRWDHERWIDVIPLNSVVDHSFLVTRVLHCFLLFPIIYYYRWMKCEIRRRNSAFRWCFGSMKKKNFKSNVHVEYVFVLVIFFLLFGSQFWRCFIVVYYVYYYYSKWKGKWNDIIIFRQVEVQRHSLCHLRYRS